MLPMKMNGITDGFDCCVDDDCDDQLVMDSVITTINNQTNNSNNNDVEATIGDEYKQRLTTQIFPSMLSPALRILNEFTDHHIVENISLS